MALNSEKYYVESENYKNNHNLTIGVGADIHFHEGFTKGVFESLVNYFTELKPDVMVIPGDIIENIQFMDITEEREYFESILKRLSSVSPVIMTPGNHEITTYYNNKKLIYNEKCVEYFYDLSNRIESFYFLNNDTVSLNGCRFIGFSPSMESYLNYSKTDYSADLIMHRDFENSGIKVFRKDYNILLSHIVPNMIYNMKYIDLVISGHWHNGYMKGNSINNKLGFIFTPLYGLNNRIIIRGQVPYGRGYSIISKGYRKWTDNNPLFNFADKFVSNNVEVIQISNPSLKLKR